MADKDWVAGDAASLRDAVPYTIRLAVLGVGLIGLCQLLYLGVSQFGADRMGAENGPIELAQVLFVCIGAGGFLIAARRSEIGVAGMWLAAAALTYAAARECDTLFERWLFDDAYKWLVGLPLVLASVVVLTKRRHRWVDDFLWSANQPATTAFVTGGILLCSLAQLLDRPGTWGELTQSPEAHATIIMVEEIVELFAYLLLSFAGVEAFLFSRRSRALDSGTADCAGAGLRGSTAQSDAGRRAA